MATKLASPSRRLIGPRSLGTGTLLAALLLTTGAPRAQPPRLRLQYSRGEGAARCPDEQALRESVAARLGYDPFHADAAAAVTATLTGGPRGLRAVVELRDPSGQVTGSRLLTTAHRDCQELSSVMALAICIAVDPFVLSRAPLPPPAPLLPSPPSSLPPPPSSLPPPPSSLPPPPSPLPAPPPAPCPACPACLPPAPAPVHFRVGAGLQVDLGATPTVGSLGVAAQAELQYRAFTLGLEGRIDPYLGSASAGANGGGVAATLLLGLILPCARWRFLGFCALLGMGALQGHGVNVAVPNQATTFYAAAGARLAFAVPLRRRLALELHLDGLAPLTRTSLAVDGTKVWATPPLAGALGALVKVLIP